MKTLTDGGWTRVSGVGNKILTILSLPIRYLSVIGVKLWDEGVVRSHSSKPGTIKFLLAGD